MGSRGLGSLLPRWCHEEPHVASEVVRATDCMKGSYDEVVELKVTFRGSDARFATAVITSWSWLNFRHPKISSCSP